MIANTTSHAGRALPNPRPTISGKSNARPAPPAAKLAFIVRDGQIRSREIVRVRTGHDLEQAGAHPLPAGATHADKWEHYLERVAKLGLPYPTPARGKPIKLK